jgi:hypothetical protein
MNEMTDSERAADLLWERDSARAENVKLRARVEELERVLAYQDAALRAEIERANAAERAAQRRGEGR